MVNIQIPHEAIEYLAFNASLEPDYAEELLQTILGMCKFEAAQPRVQPTLLTPCQYCKRVHDNRVACPEYVAKSQSG